jgi:hypothetical protein
MTTWSLFALTSRSNGFMAGNDDGGRIPSAGIWPTWNRQSKVQYGVLSQVVQDSTT